MNRIIFLMVFTLSSGLSFGQNDENDEKQEFEFAFKGVVKEMGTHKRIPECLITFSDEQGLITEVKTNKRGKYFLYKDKESKKPLFTNQTIYIIKLSKEGFDGMEVDEFTSDLEDSRTFSYEHYLSKSK